MGDNMAVKITRAGNGYAFEQCKMRECRPLRWADISSQDRCPSVARVIPASQAAGVSNLTMEIDQFSD
ncbi:hypothetical protein N7447_004365 [Penicillium robsamsonii]|uniref:uncharacterized protein n=1 Tax=Penicillium robsamsonii TaxID=1792511 RepID=UPI0025478C2A|nr:uncharacterized protein N7447_004365 [Penicillium robsamsonii]KAJ5827602.1 hypothetical protein N7447_004365 [Penicillium robsamsonii]